MSRVQDQRERDLRVKQCPLFDAENCETWRDIKQIIARKIPFEELRALAIICHENLGIELSRDLKRRQGILIAWFDDHWVFVTPFRQARVIIGGMIGKELNRSFVSHFCSLITGATQGKTF
jgi:hypothetical protein